MECIQRACRRRNGKTERSFDQLNTEMNESDLDQLITKAVEEIDILTGILSEARRQIRRGKDQSLSITIRKQAAKWAYEIASLGTLPED